MPSCFALYRKGETERSNLGDVDKAICEHLGVPVDEVKWVGNWYNTIGLCLAMGHDWEKIREIWDDRKEIVDFLEANYNPDAWKEWK